MRQVTRPFGRPAALLAAPITAAALIVTGCAETQLGAQLAKSASRDNGPERGDPVINSDQTIAPEEFDATGLTIWDGARTLQGVWVAHPLATRARRVRVVNTVTGQTVEGAMFRRDPSLSGPSILVSSDAATGLGLRPGDPTALRIVALRDPDAIPAPADPVQTTALPAPTTTPAPSATSAATPTFEASPTPVTNSGSLTPAPAAPAAPAPAPVPVAVAVAPSADPSAATAPRPEPRPAGLARAAAAPQPVARPSRSQSRDDGAQLQSGDYVQAGAFGVEGNARALVEKLRTRGLPAQYIRREVNGSIFNIVMVGPLRDEAAVARAIAEANAAGVPGARKVSL